MSHSHTKPSLRAALKWALKNGVSIVDYDNGFQHKGCGCCAYRIEPPAEIDALVREIRRELLTDEEVAK